MPALTLWLAATLVQAAAAAPPQVSNSVAEPEVRAQPLSAPAPAPLILDQQRPVDLHEVLELAAHRSLDARQAAIQSRIAAGVAQEARLEWIPSLTLSSGISRTDGQVQGSFGDFSDVDFRSVAPLARLTLGLNPARTWFEAAAAGGRSQSVAELERAVRRLVLVRVAELYFELVRERAGVEIARLAAQDAADLLRISEVLLRQGMGRGDDAERARAELAGAERRQLDAERRFHRASINLATALDLNPQITLVPAPQEFEPLALVDPSQDLEAILSQALATRPELAAARRRVEAQRADRHAVIASLAGPTLEAFYQKGATGESYGDLAGLSRYGVTATWTLSGSGLRRMETASDRNEAAALALQQAELEIRAEAIAAFDDVRLHGVRVETARRARTAAEATLRISQVRFRNGTSLAIEVLQAEQVLEQARLAEVGALADYNQAQVRLRAQLGPIGPAELSGR